MTRKSGYHRLLNSNPLYPFVSVPPKIRLTRLDNPTPIGDSDSFGAEDDHDGIGTVRTMLVPWPAAV
jgi:hypothetical protein